MKELLKIYPFNLAQSIFTDETKATEISIKGLSDALLTLTEREQGVLKMRFVFKATLQECGQAYAVSRERIRQIEAKAIRKLRHPARSNMFKAVPIAALIVETSKYHQLLYEHEVLQEAFDWYKANSTDANTTAESVATSMPQTALLEELELSVRSYNCLRRAGKRTIQDIIKMSSPDLLKVRNLGRKSAQEIISVLAMHGFLIKHEEE